MVVFLGAEVHSIGRQFLGESLKVRKYLKKVVLDIAQYKGDPHRMKTCHLSAPADSLRMYAIDAASCS